MRYLPFNPVDAKDERRLEYRYFDCYTKSIQVLEFQCLVGLSDADAMLLTFSYTISSVSNSLAPITPIPNKSKNFKLIPGYSLYQGKTTDNFSVLLIQRRSTTEKVNEAGHILNSPYLLAAYTEPQKDDVFTLIGENDYSGTAAAASSVPSFALDQRFGNMLIVGNPYPTEQKNKQIKVFQIKQSILRVKQALNLT